MALDVLAAVLGSALLLSLWNALVKAHEDNLARMATISMAAAICGIALPFLAVPPLPAWPWLILSALCSLLMQFAMARAFQLGDLSVAYPLTRGLAPLIVLLVATVLFDERLSGSMLAGIVAIAAGIVLMSRESWRGGLSGRGATLMAVAAAAVFGATLVVANAQGARLSSVLSYAVWSTVLTALAWVCFLIARGARPFAMLAADFPRALGGGLVSIGAYVLMLWAFTKAPMGMVAALRETSILFSSLIAFIWLKERMTTSRIAAALLITAGLVLLRLS